LAALVIGTSPAACSPDDESTTPAPGLIVHNADVYTVDIDVPRAIAFAVTAGKFVAVGTDENIMAVAGDQPRQVDAAGNTIAPGFIDGHQHFALGSDLTIGIDLSDIADKRV
jgi:hypothetical protein